MKSQAAFTIVELMVTIAVVGILLVMAAPSMEYMLVNGRITSKASDFIRTLHYARTEAVTRSTIVQITPSREGSGSANWSEGWEVCCDKDNQRQVKQYKDNIALALSSGQISTLRFDAKGKVLEAQSRALEFRLCSKKHPNYDGRIITIRPIGTVDVKRARVPCS